MLLKRFNEMAFSPETCFIIVCISAVFSFLSGISNSQNLSSRVCVANSELIRSRSAINSTTAASRCAAYCNSNSQASTSLYSYFCSGTNPKCAVTDYGYIAPTSSTCGIPTLTNSGDAVITVPCGLPSSVISKARLNITGGCGPYFLNQQVISSPQYDFTVGYAQPQQDGTILLGATGPLVDTTQTIAFTAQTLNPLGRDVYSNTVNIQFLFKTCVLQVTCPAAINYCATDFFNNDPTQVYSQFTCLVSNVPSGTSVEWDVPGNLGATIPDLTAGLAGFLINDCAVDTCLNSPKVINSSNSLIDLNAPADSTHIFISNYNTLVPGYLGSTTGIYGISQYVEEVGGGPDGFPSADQYLRVSATAAAPYKTGSAVVKTTYAAADGSQCPGNEACFHSYTSRVYRRSQNSTDSVTSILLIDLHIGDLVLAADSEGALTYSEVIAWLDVDYSEPKQFCRIETEDGLILTLTPSHLLYVKTTATGPLTTRYAGDVSVGDILLVIPKDTEKRSLDTINLKERKVISIELITEKGALAPLTRDGTIVVNDILSSCYAEIEDARLAHTFMAPLRWWYDYGWRIDDGTAQAQTGFHPFAQILYHIGRFLAPEGFPVDAMQTKFWYAVADYLAPQAHLFATVAKF